MHDSNALLIGILEDKVALVNKLKIRGEIKSKILLEVDLIEKKNRQIIRLYKYYKNQESFNKQKRINIKATSSV